MQVAYEENVAMKIELFSLPSHDAPEIFFSENAFSEGLMKRHLTVRRTKIEVRVVRPNKNKTVKHELKTAKRIGKLSK